jgi:hypothetical protein
MPSLTVIQGALAGRTFEFRGEAVIGRSRTSDVLVDEETVSRRHARLGHDEGAWWIEDLGSANGSRLNGKRLTSGVPLKDGDRIVLGKLEMVFRDDGRIPEARPREPGTNTAPTFKGRKERGGTEPPALPLNGHDTLSGERDRRQFSAQVARLKLFCELGLKLEQAGVQQLSTEQFLKRLLEAFPLMDEVAVLRLDKNGAPELIARDAQEESALVPDQALIQLAQEGIDAPDGIIGNDFTHVPQAVNLFKIKAVASIPVRRGGRVWGALCLLSRHSTLAIQPGDGEVLGALANIWSRIVEAWGGVAGRAQ